MPDFSCDLSQKPLAFEHFWEHTVGSGHAPLALRSDCQAQMRRCHSELGFRHVRFHDLLSDSMGTLARKPRPVPPVFQPEMAAEAIYYAAHHRRREMFVAWPTVQTVIGNRLLPGLVDRVLARVGYEGQEYDGLVPRDRPDNLWNPVPGDFGAHGDFDEEAKPSSWLLAADINRKRIATGLSVMGALGLVVARMLYRAQGKRGQRR